MAKHGTKVLNELNMTAHFSASQHCAEDTFLSKMRKIDDFSIDEESQDLIFMRMVA